MNNGRFILLTGGSHFVNICGSEPLGYGFLLLSNKMRKSNSACSSPSSSQFFFPQPLSVSCKGLVTRDPLSYSISSLTPTISAMEPQDNRWPLIVFDTFR